MIEDKFFGIGNTPLLKLGNNFGKDVYLKYEGANPYSHTFKDRGALSAVLKAQELGYRGVLAGTCSNMGTAVSAVCAKVGMPCWVVNSVKAPATTKNAISAFANKQWILKGGFDEIDSIVSELSLKYNDLGCINTNLNRYFFQGFKPILDELIERFEEGKTYNIVIPTADGTLISSLYERYNEVRPKLDKRGVTIKFSLVQPKGCMPLVQAIKENREIRDWKGPGSRITPLSVKSPAKYGNSAIAAVKDTGGCAISVEEKNIEDIAYQGSKETGLLHDSCATILYKSLKEIRSMSGTDVIIGIFTGNGLLDVHDHLWSTNDLCVKNSDINIPTSN